MPFIPKHVWVRDQEQRWQLLQQSTSLKYNLTKTHHTWNPIFPLIIVSLSKVIHWETNHFFQTTKPGPPALRVTQELQGGLLPAFRRVSQAYRSQQFCWGCKLMEDKI